MNEGLERIVNEERKEPVRAIFISGELHGGQNAKKGVFGLFDRNNFITANSFSYGLENLLISRKPSERKHIISLLNEAMKLAEQSETKIRNYSSSK